MKRLLSQWRPLFIVSVLLGMTIGLLLLPVGGQR